MSNNLYIVEYYYAPKKLYNQYLKEAKMQYRGEKILKDFHEKLCRGQFGVAQMTLKNLRSFYPPHIEQEIIKKSRLKIIAPKVTRLFIKRSNKILETMPFHNLEETIAHFAKKQMLEPIFNFGMSY